MDQTWDQAICPLCDRCWGDHDDPDFAYHMMIVRARGRRPESETAAAQAWNQYHPDQRRPLVEREHVPPTVDALDVLLAVWMAQGALEG